MSIASALFTASRIPLFRWIFGHPDQAFHLSELRRLTALGSASLQRELSRLADAGLIRSEGAGNLTRFQANSESPVHIELIGLTRKTIGMEPLLREALLPLMPRLKAGWIYGSVAKKTDTSQSDVDLMLIGENLLLSEILEHVISLETWLGTRSNPTCHAPTDFMRRRAESDSLVSRILSQPILPLIGAIDEFGSTG